jgi:competence protein ComEA
MIAAIVPAQDLPDKPGRAVVLKVCSACHGVEALTDQRRTRERWEKIVDDMAGKGATGTEAEFDAVVEYLVRNFGKVNVNKASAAEIEAVLAISTRDAAAIARYREEHGEFTTIDSLQKVPGIDAKQIADKRDAILFR